MNRTDRLLAIVLELQARGRRRADDLAAAFEVSKRTIYRDIQALCEAGVPVISTPGQGYVLLEGYFLPPLRFSTDEALILLLGSDVMAQSFDAEYRVAAQSARRKIAGALPEPLREEVRSLQESILFVAAGGPGDAHEAERLRQIRRAIVGCHTVRFDYRARQSQDGPSARSIREADPYGLAHVSGVWYLVAYCHLRKGIRNFRVDRMEQLVVLSRSFERPPGFKMQLRDDPQRPLVVRVLFDREVADWVREARSFYAVAEEERDDGLLITFRVRLEDDILGWLLGWGARVHVLEPASLRRRMAEEATQIVRNHAFDSLLT